MANGAVTTMPPDAWAQLAVMREEVTRLRALLRELEWSGITWGLGHKCPLCEGLQTKQEDYPVGHKRRCRLAAALEGRDE